MKRWILVLLMALLLTGCGTQKEELDQAMALRAKLMSAAGCSFDADITADYGAALQRFSVSCKADYQGNLTLTVNEPESIAGISGKISAEGGALTFDDKPSAASRLAVSEWRVCSRL